MAMVPVVQTVFDDVAITFGFAIGGCLELLCYHVFRVVVERILGGTRRDKARLIVVAAAVKLLALGLAIYLVSQLLPLGALAMICGVLTFAVSAIIEVVRPEAR